MDMLKNFFATLLPNSKSTRSRSLTLLSAALLLLMLASVSMQAQTKPTLVVTAIDAGRFYGDPNPAFTGTVTGLISGDTITATYSAVADSSSPVGEYKIVPTLVDPDNHLGNYTVVINTGTLTVTAAPLSIVADDLQKAAGQANPAFTGTVSGVKNGEAITATFDCSATATSGSGAYAIVPTVLDGSGKISNYAVTVSNGTLTVTP